MLDIALRRIVKPVALDMLPFEPLLELQRGLALLGYPVRGLDGALGPRTRGAWAEFQLSCGIDADGMVAPGLIGRLRDQAAMLEEPDQADLTTRDGTIAAIIAACPRYGLGLRDQIAYVLATVEHETNRSFLPVREGYYLGGAKADKFQKSLKYYPYYGRGYVQLTWRANYEFYGDLLQRPLVSQPDTALEPAVSLFVLLHGFRTGAFTGRRLDDFIGARGTDFIQARRCINGLDRAAEIAELARGLVKTLPPP